MLDASRVDVMLLADKYQLRNSIPFEFLHSSYSNDYNYDYDNNEEDDEDNDDKDIKKVFT